MKFRVSKDTPAYYLTAVAKDRLPIFRTETIARIACDAINESRNRHGFLIFAYVRMLDHIHLVSDSKFNPSELQQLINGIVGKRILNHLIAPMDTLIAGQTKDRETLGQGGVCCLAATPRHKTFMERRNVAAEDIVHALESGACRISRESR